MDETTARALGLGVTVTYAVLIGWLYVRQPQTISQAIGGLSSVVGAYRVDDQAKRSKPSFSYSAAARRRIIALLIPESGLPRLAVGVFFVILLLNTSAASPDRQRLLRSLAVTFGTALS
jgi:hypothetical protein